MAILHKTIHINTKHKENIQLNTEYIIIFLHIFIKSSSAVKLLV